MNKILKIRITLDNEIVYDDGAVLEERFNDEQMEVLIHAYFKEQARKVIGSLNEQKIN